MNTPTIDIQAILDGPYKTSPSGCDCTFVKLDDKWGLKIYRCQETRDVAYENQSNCADIGLGPEVGESIDFLEANRYAYVTEIIEPVGPSEDEYNDDRNSHRKKRNQWEYETRIERDAIVNMISDETGWFFHDSHYFNWGTKDGQLMPLDFG
jgi:hypothetical protein